MTEKKPVRFHDDNRGPWMQTATAKKFFFITDIDELIAQIDPRDIAIASGNICRFGGHVRRFYSIAEHGVRVSWLAEPKYRPVFLLHDGGESYTGDIVYPLKSLLRGTPFEDRADFIQDGLYERWNLTQLYRECRSELKYADLQMLACEARDVLFEGAIEEWDKRELPPPPIGMRIQKPWKPKTARARFLDHLIAYLGLDFRTRYIATARETIEL